MRNGPYSLHRFSGNAGYKEGMMREGSCIRSLALDFAFAEMRSKPGVAYFVRKLPSLLLAPSLVLVLFVIYSRFLNTNISPPTWALVLACLLSWPAQLFLTVKTRDVLKLMEARKRGARLPPVLKHAIPGNYESVKKVFEMRASGYLGWSTLPGLLSVCVTDDLFVRSYSVLAVDGAIWKNFQSENFL